MEYDYRYIKSNDKKKIEFFAFFLNHANSNYKFNNFMSACMWGVGSLTHTHHDALKVLIFILMSMY